MITTTTTTTAAAAAAAATTTITTTTAAATATTTTVTVTADDVPVLKVHNLISFHAQRKVALKYFNGRLPWNVNCP